MPTFLRLHIPCRPAYQREATPHRRVERSSIQCRPPDKAVPSAQKQVRHFQCGHEFCDFAVAYNTVHKEWVHGKNFLSDDKDLSSLQFHASQPQFSVLSLNFKLFFSFSVAARLYMYTIGQRMVSSKGYSTGSAIRTSGTMLIKPVLFYGIRIFIFQLLFVWRRLAMVYLNSCVAEVIFLVMSPFEVILPWFRGRYRFNGCFDCT